MCPLTMPMDYYTDPGDPQLEVHEQEVLVKTKHYEDLRRQHGFTLLMDFLNRQRESALLALKENGDPEQDKALLIRWREREALMDAINHEIDSTLEMAKEIKDARRQTEG